MKPQRAQVAALVLATALAAFLFAACGSSDDTTGGTDSGGEKPKVAAVSIAGNETFALYSKGFERAADELGLDLEVFNAPNFEASAVSSTISSAVATNPDYLVVSAVDSAAMRQPLLDAKERGIEVITYDTQVDEPDFVLSYVNSDYHEYGVLSAEALGDAIEGDGKKGQLLTVIPGNQDLERMIEGFDETLREGLTPLPTQYSLGENGKANEITRSLLTREPDLGGIVGVSSFGGEGMVAALREAGAIGKVKAVLQIANAFAVNALRKGEVQAVIGDQPENIGAAAVEAAYHDANGEPVQSEVKIPLCILTADNVDDPENADCIH